MLPLKIISAGVLASAVVWLASTGNTKLAGLFISFPVVLLSSLLIISASNGQDAVLGVVRANILALPVWLLTAAAIYFSARYINLPIAAFLIGSATWLVSAFIWMKLS